MLRCGDRESVIVSWSSRQISISDDSVHLPNDSALSEYIENDVGIIYRGAHKQPSGRQWIFGQFDSVVLPACCHILDKSRRGAYITYIYPILKYFLH